MQPNTRSVPRCFHTLHRWEVRECMRVCVCMGRGEEGRYDCRAQDSVYLKSCASFQSGPYKFFSDWRNRADFVSGQQRVVSNIKSNSTKISFLAHYTTSKTQAKVSTQEPAVSHAAWTASCFSGIFIAWMTPSGQRLPWEAVALKNKRKKGKERKKEKMKLLQTQAAFFDCSCWIA